MSGLKNQIRLLLSRLWAGMARRQGVEVGEEVVFNGRPSLKLCGGSRVQIATGVTLNSYGRSNPLYCAQPVSLCTLAPGAVIKIGARAGLSGSSLCALSGIEIGEDTLIGVGCRIFDNDFHLRSEDGQRWRSPEVHEARRVTIGKKVFVGAGVTILKGVTIGDGATIGAGAVVTRDVPPHSVAVGQAAKILRIQNEVP